MDSTQVQHSRLEQTTHLAANAIRLVRNPRMVALYLRWQAARIALQRSPVHNHCGSVRIGNFCSFSHFWLWRDGVSAAEMRLLEFCRRALAFERRWIAADVGAHLGHFALALAAIGFDEVHAFEPAPQTYRRLQRNITMNARLADCVTAHPLCVADIPGTAVFAIREHSPGQNRIATAEDQDRLEYIHCPQTTLDDQFAHRPEAFLGIVKIDVEGFETSVVRGAARLLAQDRIMFVYAEIIPQALREAESSAEDLVASLAAEDLVLVQFVPTASPMLIQCSLPDALDSSSQTRNVLFAHKRVLQATDQWLRQ